MHAPDHMVDVLDAAAEIGIVHGLEHGGQAVALQAQRVVGAVTLRADQLVEALQQLGVVQQQAVQVEELADLVRQRAVQAVAHVADFHAHRIDGGVQAAQLGVHRGRRDAFLGHFQRMRQPHPRPPQGIAARCPVAGERLAHQRTPRRWCGRGPAGTGLQAKSLWRRCGPGAIPAHCRASCSVIGRATLRIPLLSPSHCAPRGTAVPTLSRSRRISVRTAPPPTPSPRPRPRLPGAAPPWCRVRRRAASRP